MMLNCRCVTCLITNNTQEEKPFKKYDNEWNRRDGQF